MDIPHDINRRRWRRRGRVGLGHSTLLWVQEPGGAAKGAEAGSHCGAKLRAVGNEPFPFEGFARGCRISACRRGSGHLDTDPVAAARSDEHTSELQSLMRISYAVFCLTKKTYTQY